MLRRKLSRLEHDLSSTQSSVLSDDSVCSDDCDKHTECESMINMGKTDKVHEILDKVQYVHEILDKVDKTTEVKVSNVFKVDENGDKQCFAAHVVQCCQQNIVQHS